MATAAYVELHVHGLVDLGRAEASFLALSPEPDGRFALTAADLRRARLAAAPVVVLAACRAAAATPLVNRRWSLPDAFLAAGARTVIAAAVPIPDDQAAAFFASLRARLAAGATPGGRGRRRAGRWPRAVAGRGDGVRVAATGGGGVCARVRPAMTAREPQVVAVGGGKGGVGKSLIAANLGIFLATLGKKVVVVDCSLGAPNLHLFCGVPRPTRTLAEALVPGGAPLADLAGVDAGARHAPHRRRRRPGLGGRRRPRDRAGAPGRGARAAVRLGRARPGRRHERGRPRAVPRRRRRHRRRGARPDLGRADAPVHRRGVPPPPASARPERSGRAPRRAQGRHRRAARDLPRRRRGRRSVPRAPARRDPRLRAAAGDQRRALQARHGAGPRDHLGDPPPARRADRLPRAPRVRRGGVGLDPAAPAALGRAPRGPHHQVHREGHAQPDGGARARSGRRAPAVGLALRSARGDAVGELRGHPPRQTAASATSTAPSRSRSPGCTTRPASRRSTAASTSRTRP
jgi:hypothetical protein